MVGGLLVFLLLHGLAANRGVEELRNPTARESNVRMNMEKFAARGKRVFPMQPDWMVKIIHEKYADLEKILVRAQPLTVMSKVRGSLVQNYIW